MPTILSIGVLSVSQVFFRRTFNGHNFGMLVMGSRERICLQGSEFLSERNVIFGGYELVSEKERLELDQMVADLFDLLRCDNSSMRESHTSAPMRVVNGSIFIR
ncbi:hypothetical protein A0W34_30510 (plasmid) [Rhodococcus sp. BH4]|nr:hypothetical protein A0W34_30510 [Rhodococcus sp. BH4]